MTNRLSGVRSPRFYLTISEDRTGPVEIIISDDFGNVIGVSASLDNILSIPGSVAIDI